MKSAACCYTLYVLCICSLMLPSCASLGHTQVSGVHDVAVSRVTVDCSIVWFFYPSRVNVTVANYGTYDETVNVTVYMNDTAIKEVDNVFLTSNSSFMFSFLWDGSRSTFWYGSYILSAYVHPVQNETNISNNRFVEGIVKLAKTGDANGDGVVNALDLILIASHLGKIAPFGYYQPPLFSPIPFRVGVNGNYKVNVLNLIAVANWLGH